MPTDFTYNNGSVPATKTNLNALPGGADVTKYVQDVDVNAITAAILSLRQAILAGQYYALLDNPSGGLSSAGGLRVQSLSGQLSASENGGAFIPVGKPDIQAYSATTGALATAVRRDMIVLVNLNGNFTASNPVLSAGATLAGGTGTRLRFVFTQDSTGGRTVTFSGSNFKDAARFVARRGKTQRSAIEFTLAADGTWTRSAMDGIDLQDKISAKDFGAAGDNSTDDTAALQAWLTFLATGNRWGYLPQGTYLISKPIRFDGTPPGTVRISGQVGGSSGNTSVIQWSGATGAVTCAIGGLVRLTNVVTATVASHPFAIGDRVFLSATEGTAFYAGEKTITGISGTTFTYAETGSNATSANAHYFGQAMLTFRSLQSSRLENFELNGNGTAFAGLWIQDQSFSVLLDHVASAQCGIVNGGSALLVAGGGNVLIGIPPDGGGTHQTSEIHFKDCFGGGNDGASHYSDAHYLFLSGGNTTNCRFTGGQISGANTSIDATCPGGGGNLMVDGMTATHVNAVFYKGGSNGTRLSNIEIETGTTAATFVQQGPSGSVSVENCSWSGALPFAGGSPGTDDVVINVVGNLYMRGNTFSNTRTGSTIPWVVVDNSTCDWSATSNNVGSVQSFQNTFLNVVAASIMAPAFAPIRDSSDNHLVPLTEANGGFVRVTRAYATSWGDLGGAGGSPIKLANVDSYPASLSLLFGKIPDSNVKIHRMGEPANGMFKATLPYQAFQTGALTRNVTTYIFEGGNKLFLERVVVDTTVAFGGTAGTLQLSIGTDTGANVASLISAHDVKSAPVTKGLVDGDLGAALAKATNTQGGTFISWGGGGPSIYVTLVSSSGNLSGLNAGSVDVYFKMETFT